MSSSIKLSETDLYWLAGLLEGEGHFRWQKPTNHGSGQWMIVMSSIDLDIISRVAALLHVNVCGPYNQARQTVPHYKLWVTRRVTVIELCELLYPLMGNRRQQQIQGMLDQHYKS